jgi:iduronate 2-sulfatase
MLINLSFRLIVLTGLLVPSAIPLASAAEPAKAAPNVLFIVADDLRPDLGCFGSALARTPHLDRLASSGTRFERAYCQQAVCNPSRASALTGLRPDSLRVHDLQTRFRETLPTAMTIPEFFKSHGYVTRGIGKIFHNESRPEKNRVPFSDPPSWSIPPIYSDGAHWQDWVVPGEPSGPSKKQEAWQCLDVPDEAYFDGQIAAAACTALEEQARDGKPFFLGVGFWKPHLPFNAPKQYWDLYERETFEDFSPPAFPKGAPDITRHDWRELRTYKGMPPQGPLSPEDTLTLRHGYFACISFLDAQIGKVLDKLEALGLADNTIVVFWSDHGFHLGEHELWAKTTNFELDARVPLIIRAPRQQHTRSTAAIVELVDLFPTLADLADLPIPTHLEGSSLRALLDNGDAPGRPFALTQHPHPFYTANWTHMGYSLRTDAFRYVEWRDRHTGTIAETELYDHTMDPLESTNLAHHPDYLSALETLRALAETAYTYTP